MLEEVTVPDDAPCGSGWTAQRPSNWLDAFPTRASARKAALRGELAVDGEISEPARWVAPGDRVCWLEPADAVAGSPLRVALPVVFEDEHLAVVHKPGGWATSGNLPRTLASRAP